MTSHYFFRFSSFLSNEKRYSVPAAAYAPFAVQGEKLRPPVSCVLCPEFANYLQFHYLFIFCNFS